MTVLTDLATAYVSLRVSTGGMQGDVKKALTGIESDAQKTGQSMGSKISSGIGSVLKKTAVGVGVAGGAALAAGLTKGIGRLASIETAEAKLTGLGNSASTVGGVMENALAAVKGTAFGLEEAATVAAGMVAAGIKPGQELEGVLKTVGDTAAIAGVSMQDMGSIFGKVAATGKLQGDELMQLSDAGIPALSLLSKHLGKTTEEVRDMVSAGKISFADFEAAMKGGVGGAALEMGNTTTGALKNMMAAAGRLGATLAGPFFTQAGGAFRGVTDLLDGLNAKAGPVMERFGGWLEGTAVPALVAFGVSASDAFKQFAQSEFVRVAMADLKGIFSSLSSTAGEVWPSLVKIGGALADASAALGVSAWSAFVASLQVVSGVLSALTGPLELVADVMRAQPGLVTAAVAAWMAFKTVPSLVGGVSKATDFLSLSMEKARTSTGSLKSSFKDMVGGLDMLNIGVAAASIAVGLAISENQKLESAQRDLEAASASLAGAQSDMWASIGDSAGVADAVAEQVKALGATLDAELSGERRGWARFFGSGLIDELNGTVSAANETADSARAAKSAMDDLGISQEQVANAIQGSQGGWDMFVAHLRGAGDAGADLLARYQPLRDEFVAMQAMTDRVGPGFFTLRDALDVLGDSASTADQKLNSMRVALEQMGLIQTTADQQIANVAAQVERLGDAVSGTTFGVDEFGRAFQNADGSLNLLNTNTHALNDALVGTRDELLGVASSGGDALGLFEQMQPEIESLRAQVEAAGYDFDGYLESIGLTPEAISTAVALTGTDETRADLLAITDKLREAEIGAEVPVTIRGGEEGRAQIEALGIKVHEMNYTTGEATVSVRNQEALDRIWQTHGSLDVLDSKSSISDILAVNGDAQGKIWQSQTGLNQLDATNPLSVISAENGQAQGAIGGTQGGLDKLGATHPNSRITADNSQADSAIQQVQRWIAPLLVPKTVRVVFNAVYQGFKDILGGGSDNAAGGAWNGTQALARFAAGGHSGYRLPTSGPGTDEVDGFLAFNSQGIPAARLDAGEWIINGRSSEKYNRELAQINAGTFPKLPGYKDGGRADAKELLDFVHGRGGHGQSQPLEGAPYVWGGVNWGDCSGAMSAIARFAVGIAPFAARFATGNMGAALRELGFLSGRGGDGDLRFGWKNGGPGGGHTSGTLPDGTNVEMGGGRGNGQIGGSAAPASHSQYTDHAHLPVHTYQFDRVEGLEGLMPPGASTTWAGMAGTAGTSGTTSPGLYKSPGNSGQVDKNQPRTWSDMAAGAVSALVGGQVEDALGVFGVPNQLPPIVQAWQMLNEKPGGGPSDWDLSTAAAEVKRLDAAIKIREQVTGEAAKALSAMNGNGVGNALPAAVRSAESELDKQLIELESDRLSYERAQDRLRSLLGARAAAVAEKDLTSASSASDLASSLAPDVSMPDELMRELKVAYDPAGGAEQWRPLVEKLLKEKGQPLEYADSVIARLNQESGGNPKAQNDWDSNAKAGNPSKGGMQTTQTTFDAFKDPGHGDIWNMEDNIRASMNYVLRDPKFKGRTLKDVYLQAGGYSSGGWINGVGTKDSVPLVGAPGEFIVNRRAAAENREELEAMNAGRSVSSRGGSVTYNIHTFDLDEAMRELSRREAQHAQTHLGAR